MERIELKKIGSNPANVGAHESRHPEEAAAALPYTAIERQIAAMSALRYKQHLQEEEARKKRRRINFASFLGLLLLIAGLALLFVYLGHPFPRDFAAASELAGRVVRDGDPLSADASSAVSPTVNSPEPVSLQETERSQETDSSQEIGRPPEIDKSHETDRTHETNKPQEISAGAIAVPIADVSLRNRPELLEQLVQIYRSRLANSPNDAAAQAALNRLQDKSLTELETIMTEESDTIAVGSLEIVARLFPGAADSIRYKYVASRLERSRRAPTNEQRIDSAAKPNPVDVKNDAVKNNAVRTSASKPEIRTVAITPGTMIQDSFVPGDDGDVFLVEISYRNFNKAFVDQNEATLITRLGIPGDSMVLAEVPVVISADRGTKSFIMETLAQGRAGGKFQLNFILNDEFLTSRVVRLAVPGS